MLNTLFCPLVGKPEGKLELIERAGMPSQDKHPDCPGGKVRPQCGSAGSAEAFGMLCGSVAAGSATRSACAVRV